MAGRAAALRLLVALLVVLALLGSGAAQLAGGPHRRGVPLTLPAALTAGAP